MKRQLWSPDTCDCTLEQLYQPEMPRDQWQHRVVKKCAVHQSVPDDQLDEVCYRQENLVKNRMEAFLLDAAVGGASETYLDDNGKQQVRWKAGVVYDWWFDPNRVLHVRVKGATLPANVRRAVADRAAQAFGGGKVVLEE